MSNNVAFMCEFHHFYDDNFLLDPSIYCFLKTNKNIKKKIIKEYQTLDNFKLDFIIYVYKKMASPDYGVDLHPDFKEFASYSLNYELNLIYDHEAQLKKMSFNDFEYFTLYNRMSWDKFINSFYEEDEILYEGKKVNKNMVVSMFYNVYQSIIIAIRNANGLLSKSYIRDCAENLLHIKLHKKTPY
jgi:hypothetical protein